VGYALADHGPRRMEFRLNGASADTLDRARRVRLVLLDSDGVLTDGRIIVTSDGSEARCFDVRDGHGIRMGQRAGLSFGVISGRESLALTARAGELGIDEIHQTVHDKLRLVREILARRGLEPREVCFVGDDLIDVPAMRYCGLAIAPADAIEEVRAVAHHVTERKGGRGAVREVVDMLLRASGSWNKVTERYFTEH
jgi:3-deoxy-D-manno-octulosonate 8-phosphate phosphatase (KDO 8-P phosphatase)